MATLRALGIITLALFSSSFAYADTVAWTGGTVIDGTGGSALENAAIVAENGRITAVGPLGSVTIPEDARRIDVTGQFLIPGMINAHGHVGDVRGLETGHYTRGNLQRQLSLYARYGITTVASLGGDEAAAFALREQQDAPGLDRARLLLAGPVLNPESPADAAMQVAEVAALGADFVKVRIDDFLGRGSKMEPEVYQAVGRAAARHDLPFAVHIYELADAKAALRAGASHIVHSVRDRHVDEEFIALMKEHQACYVPTLTRELSTYVYGDRPAFFSDPFFLREVDDSIIAALSDPQRQQRIREDEAAQTYRAALPVAMSNLKILHDAGVLIAMGTDSGPPTRFQGYFEHLEMWMMADAGLTPDDILLSATADAARCLGLERAGTLEPGQHADIVVLTDNPLDDIDNTDSISAVYIAGNRVPPRL